MLIVQLRAPDGGALTEEQRNDTEAVISARLQALPDARLLMSTLPDDQLRFDLNDPAQLGAIRHVVTAPGILTFVAIPDELARMRSMDGRPLPDGVGTEPLIVTNDAIVSDRPLHPTELR